MNIVKTCSASFCIIVGCCLLKRTFFANVFRVVGNEGCSEVLDSGRVSYGDAFLAVSENGEMLEGFPLLQNDVAIVRAAVTQNGYALRFSLLKNDEICMFAVNQNWRALEHVGSLLKGNRTNVVELALKNSKGYALEFVSGDLQDNYSLVRELAGAYLEDLGFVKFATIRVQSLLKQHCPELF